MMEYNQPSPYSEEEYWQRVNITSERELEIAVIRERLLRCNPLDLHRLLTRVDMLLSELPTIPMTEEQRENARRLANGFRSLFVVEREKPPQSG